MSTTDEGDRRAAFARVQARFEELAELDAAERDARLSELRRTEPEAARELDQLFAAERAAPTFLDQPAGALEGVIVGRWRVEERLASGGMGDVYRVRRVDADLPWDAALKVLRAGCSDAEPRRRFMAEGRALAALTHPDIVSLLDVGTLDDGRPWFVMELVDGLPIDRHCDRFRLGLRARLELFLRVCSAVRHAHRRLVLHCDLKPSNVLVSADGDPKLLDFGIAELVAAAAADGRGWPTTPGYSSPEQVRGDPLTVGADVWSLGALLHELLTGALPAVGDAREEPLPPRLLLGANGEHRTPLGPAGKAARLLRGDLDAILLRALAVDPARRYDTVDALVADVRAHLDGRPIEARHLPARERLIRAAGRHRIAVLSALVAVACLATLVTREILRGRAEARLGWRAHTEAVQVTRLLEDLLRDAGPGAINGAKEFERRLDQASVRAGEDFDDSPETLGRLRIAFGSLYLDLNLPVKAEKELRHGLALARTHRGFGRVDIERAEGLLARATGAVGASESER